MNGTTHPALLLSAATGTATETAPRLETFYLRAAAMGHSHDDADRALARAQGPYAGSTPTPEECAHALSLLRAGDQ